MTTRRIALAVAFLTFGGAALPAWQAFSSFLGAGPGAAVPFQYVALPPVASGPMLPFKSGPFGPTQEQLLNGETIVTTSAQMKEVWLRLFKQPYDPSLFDFQNDFVVLMGGGSLVLGSFDISSVEQATGSFANVGGLGGPQVDELFLAITATTFLPGVFPQDPPPPTWRISAVRISKSLFDDVVFHRSIVMGV